MRDEDIFVGSVLRVRSYEELSIEDRERRILFGFSSLMKNMCGKIFTVKKIDRSSGRYYRYYSEEGVETIRGRTWAVSADMLEPIDELVEITPFTDDEMRLLLGI